MSLWRWSMRCLRGLLLVLPLPLLLLAVVLAMANSQSGSRWLIQQVLPTEASITDIDGTLLHRLQLAGVQYHADGTQLKLRYLSLAWSPLDLLKGALQIDEIAIQGLELTLESDTQQADASSHFDPEASLPVPLALRLDRLTVNDATFIQSGQRHDLPNLTLSANTEGGRLHLTHMVAEAADYQLDLNGWLGLGGGYPLALNAKCQLRSAEYGDWQTASKFSGDLKRLILDISASGPFAATLHGQIDELLQTPGFALQGDWVDARWPLVGNLPQLTSPQGSLTVQGSASAFQAKLTADVRRAELPDAHVDLAMEGTPTSAKLQRFLVASKAGSLAVDGTIAWQDAVQFALHAQARDFNPAVLLPDLPGRLSLDGDVEGRLNTGAPQLKAQLHRLDGQLLGQPLSGGGKFALDGQVVAVDQLQLSSGSNRLHADGRLGPAESALRFDLHTPALAGLWPGLRGKAHVNGLLRGDWHLPDIELTAQAAGLGYAQQQVGAFDLTLDFQPNAHSRLQMHAQHVLSGHDTIDSVAIAASGTTAKHSVSLDVRAPQGQLALALAGRWQAPRWQGALQALSLQVPQLGAWELRQAAALTIDQRPAGADVRLADTCLTQANALICLQGDYLANGDLSGQGRVSDYPLDLLSAYLPAHWQLFGSLAATAEVRKRGSGLQGDYRLALAEAGVSLPVGRNGLVVPFRKAILFGNLAGERLTADLDLATDGSDFIRAQLQLDQGAGQGLAGNLAAKINDLGLFQGLVPNMSGLKGRFGADLKLGGSLPQPVAQGRLSLEDGRLQIDELGIVLSDIQLHADAVNDDQPLQVHGSLRSGGGRLAIDGLLGLDGTADLDVLGNDFEVAKLPEAEVTIAPHLKLGRSARGDAKVTGALGIDKAMVKIKELPASAVAVSRDEVIVGKTDSDQAIEAPPGIDADVAIQLGQQASFSGLGLDTKLTGQLQFLKLDRRLALHGAIDMADGRYRSYGQDLKLRKGRFLFNGPIDRPWLDVEAYRVSKDQKVTAVLQVSGSATAPQTKIYTEPSLPESDALAYLITGASLNQAGKDEGNMIASAALSYGAGRLSWLTEKLGIDEFEVQQGKSFADTLVTAGQYLTANTYVGTKLGLFSKQALLVLKYKLTDSINLETQTGTSQRVKVNYEFDTD
ncbi:translocation/assembly module TamB domain-containing protein [Methylomonas sp. WH-1]|uniref:translocation/assembly module TamB domain-containing protein n=1 Tax=unclassified Methylomonas TaxID=2608980 RepID=UPI00193FDEFA|nr:translocation/assembly module TamB domain-containing protein [Methylomonas sp. LW13]